MRRNHPVARREFLRVIGGVGGLLALDACVGASPSTPPNSAPPPAPTPAATNAPATAAPAASKSVTITTSITPDFVQVPLILAAQMGAFARYGLDESNAPMAAGVMTAALISKSATYATISVAGPMLGMVNKGKNIIAFGQLTHQNSNLLSVSTQFTNAANVPANASTTDKLKALKGARWASISPNSATQVVIEYLMSQVGYQPNRDYSVTFINSIDGMVSALNQKQIDAFLANAPGPQTVAANGTGVTYLDLATAQLPAFDGMSWAVLWALREDLDANPDLAKATLRAVWAAQKLLQTDPNKAKDLIRPTFASLPQNVFDQCWTDSLALYPASPRITADSFDKGLKLFNQQSEATDQVSKPAQDLFTNEYVDAIAQEFA